MPAKATPRRISRRKTHGMSKPTNDIVCGDSDEQLVQNPGEKEDCDLCQRRWTSSPNKRAVDVTAHEVGHGLVPRRPVDAHAANVPPVAVELAVAEPHDFGQSIQERLEHGEEAAKPAKQRDGGEFHDTFHDGDKVHGQQPIHGIL